MLAIAWATTGQQEPRDVVEWDTLDARPAMRTSGVTFLQARVRSTAMSVQTGADCSRVSVFDMRGTPWGGEVRR